MRLAAPVWLPRLYAQAHDGYAAMAPVHQPWPSQSTRRLLLCTSRIGFISGCSTPSSWIIQEAILVRVTWCPSRFNIHSYRYKGKPSAYFDVMMCANKDGLAMHLPSGCTGRLAATICSLMSACSKTAFSFQYSSTLSCAGISRSCSFTLVKKVLLAPAFSRSLRVSSMRS